VQQHGVVAVFPHADVQVVAGERFTDMYARERQRSVERDVATDVRAVSSYHSLRRTLQYKRYVRSKVAVPVDVHVFVSDFDGGRK